MSEHTRELRLSEAQREREELDELLDQALRQTFPASDPISLQFDRKSRRSVAAAGGSCRRASRRALLLGTDKERGQHDPASAE